MSKKTNNKKSVTPTVMNPWMFMSPELMSQWQTQMMATMASTPTSSTSKEAAASKAPWQSSGESSSSEDDFQPSQKKLKFSKGSKMASQAKTESGHSGGKPGRPKKAITQLKEAQSAADKKILDNYPDATGHDTFPIKTVDECRCCKLWTGIFVVVPCGHCKYCYSCISKLKNEAIELQRPGKCPAEKCFSLVKSWVKLYNVSP